MPQALLPLIPDGATRVSDLISVVQESHRWTYFCGVAPVFHHAQDDGRSFRMFTAQLVCLGTCRQIDIIRAFGVSANSVRRSVAKYEQEGIAVFFQPRKARGPTVMTDEVIMQAQQLLSRAAVGCPLRHAPQSHQSRTSVRTAASNQRRPA